MNLRLLLTIFIFVGLASFSCRNSELGRKKDKSEVKISIERFDRELFLMNQDTLPAAINSLYKKYDDFLDAFSYHVISIGSPSARDYQPFLSMFLNDRLNREVFDATQIVFPELTALERELSKAFSIYKAEFPEKEVPRVISYVSRFNNPSCFTVSNYIGVCLDRYLGSGSEYYKKLELPLYTRMNMFPEKIASDLLYSLGTATFPYNDSIDNVLSRMIHEGKILYFAKYMLPKEPDSLIIGFTKSQMKWVDENEEQMWTSLVEKKLLFSRNSMDIRKLTGAAPFTYFFSNESPGRAGTYIGWRIYSEYARKNPKISLAEMMAEGDYEKILRLSKYNP